MLKKEFKNTDLQRIRNLIGKKYGDSVKTQIGFTQSEQEHKEGDIFEESGKRWIIKNGIRITYNKTHSVREQLSMPMFCPECGEPMIGKFDKKMYFIHKKCFNCVIKFETQLRIDGKYEVYVSEQIKTNANALLADFENEVIEVLNESTQTVTENGEIEEWGGGDIDKEKIIEEVRGYIEKIKSELE